MRTGDGGGREGGGVILQTLLGPLITRPCGFDNTNWALINPPIDLTSTNFRWAGDVYIKEWMIVIVLTI